MSPVMMVVADANSHAMVTVSSVMVVMTMRSYSVPVVPYATMVMVVVRAVPRSSVTSSSATPRHLLEARSLTRSLLDVWITLFTFLHFS